MIVNAAISNAFDKVLAVTGDRLGPVGYRRCGPILRLHDQGNCGVIEFQRSMKNSRDKLLFTVNVGIVCGDIMDSEAPLGDIRKARVINAQVRLRIGGFLPGRPDKWWEITNTTDADSLAREVSDLLFAEAVPYIALHISTAAIISLWESGQGPGLTDRQRADLLAVLKAKR